MIFVHLAFSGPYSYLSLVFTGLILFWLSTKLKETDTHVGIVTVFSWLRSKEFQVIILTQFGYLEVGRSQSLIMWVLTVSSE